MRYETLNKTFRWRDILQWNRAGVARINAQALEQTISELT
jgi:hypothetical protein